MTSLCVLSAGAVVVQAVVAHKPALLAVGVVLVAFAAWAGSAIMETARLEIDDEAGTLSIARKSFARTLPLASIESIEVTEFRLPGDLDADVTYTIELVAEGERLALLPGSKAKRAQDWAAAKVRVFLANADPTVQT